MKTHEVRVTGKVQGVYFRVSAKQKAMNLGICGYVRNEPDGSVSLTIEGEDEAVNNMVNWCKQGPALARVKEIEVKSKLTQNFNGFEIKH